MLDQLAPVRLEIVEGADLTRDDEGWEHYAYTVRLTRGDHSMTVPWRQGIGLTDDPDAATVLESLLMDASGVENAAGDFEQWASEYGFDTDSRKAEAIFRQATEQTEQLRELLGEEFDAAVFPDSLDAEDVGERLASGDGLGTYKIVRMYADERPSETIETGLTRAEAQAHCRRDDTHGDGWFDGFEEE